MARWNNDPDVIHGGGYEELMAFLAQHPDAVIDSVRPVTVDPVTGEERDASFPWMDDFEDDWYDDLLDEAIDCLNVGDYEQAVSYLTESAEDGNSNAQFNLGLCYAKGCGVKRDFRKAAEWMRKAAENGDEDAEPLIEQFGKAETLRKKAEAGDAAAQGELAGFYLDLAGALTQFGEMNDHKAAYEWAKKAAGQNDPEGLYRLAQCCQNGWGVQRNYSSALRCFRSGAELGHPGCQRDLGIWYLEGTHVKKSEKKGFQLNLDAAVQGDSQAMFNVGMCYQLGRGVGYSLKRALDWYEASQERFPKPELAQRIQALKSLPNLEKEESATGLPAGHKKDFAAARATNGRKGGRSRKTKKTTGTKQEDPPEKSENSVSFLPSDNATAEEYLAAAERLKRNAWEMLAKAEVYREKAEAIRKGQYEEAVQLMEGAAKPEEYHQAAAAFKKLSGYLDADSLGKECRTKEKALLKQKEEKRNRSKYNKALRLMKAAENPEEFHQAAEAFGEIPGYLDANALREECRKQEIELREQYGHYEQGKTIMETATRPEMYREAAESFDKIPGFKDADNLAERCRMKEEELKEQLKRDRKQYEKARGLMEWPSTAEKYRQAAEVFEAISGFLDADALREVCLKKEKELNEKQERQKQQKRQYETAVQSMEKAETLGEYHRAVEAFTILSGYLDADSLRAKCEKQKRALLERSKLLRKEKNELTEKANALSQEINSIKSDIEDSKDKGEAAVASIYKKIRDLEDLAEEWKSEIEEARAAENDADGLWQQIHDLQLRKNSLGFFAGKEKREITDKIWVLNSKLEESEKKAGNLRSLWEQYSETRQSIQALREESERTKAALADESKRKEDGLEILIQKRNKINERLDEIEVQLAVIDPEELGLTR